MLPVTQGHDVHDAVTRCEAPPQSLSFIIIFLCLVGSFRLSVLQATGNWARTWE